MGFAAGSVSFRRFRVVGEAPAMVEQGLLDKLAEFQLREAEVGVPNEVEYGWCGGRHIFDATFSFEHNVFNDCLLFALRLDTNRVPGEVKKAYQAMEEEAAAANNPSGFISKAQKKDVKDTVRQKVDEDLRSGRFRRSKLIPVLWDLTTATLYTPAAASVNDKLMELFERTFGLTLEAQSAGTMGLAVLESIGRRRDYEDLRPTRFALGPEGDGQHPEYPWCAKGPQPKDFMGNEFLMWLWHEVDAHRGAVIAEKVGEVSILIDKVLDLDCAYGQTGRDFLRGDGPTQMPEARDAIKSGKVPRKMGLVLETNGAQFNLTFSAEPFSFGAAKLPEIEEAENPRVVFEERIALIRELCKSADALYETFLKLRASAKWEGIAGAVRRWIMASGKQAAA